MTETVALSLLVQPRREGFEVVKDDEYRQFENPVYDYAVLSTHPDWSTSTGWPDLSERSLALTLLSYAVVRIRVFAPAGTITVTPLDALDQAQGNGQFSNGGYTFTKIQPNYLGNQVESLGRKTVTEREVLTFDGSVEAAVRFGYTDPTVTVLDASGFVNLKGEIVAAPTDIGKGVFRAAEPVYGALAVEYDTEYSEYDVFYDIPSAEYRFVPYDTSRTYSERVPAPVAPLVIVAKSADRAQMLTIPREVRFPYIEWGSTSNVAGDFEGTEDLGARESVTTNIEGVDVERITKITLVADDGRTMVLNIADPDAP